MVTLSMDTAFSLTNFLMYPAKMISRMRVSAEQDFCDCCLYIAFINLYLAYSTINTNIMKKVTHTELTTEEKHKVLY